MKYIISTFTMLGCDKPLLIRPCVHSSAGVLCIRHTSNRLVYENL